MAVGRPRPRPPLANAEERSPITPRAVMARICGARRAGERASTEAAGCDARGLGQAGQRF